MIILLTKILCAFKFNEEYIDIVFNDNDTANTFLCQIGIFRNKMKCFKFSEEVQLSLVKRKNAPDGYHWACKRPCTFTCSLRSCSFFEYYKLSMKQIFKIIYKYINGISFVDTAYDLSISRNTASGIADLIREIICEYILESNNRLGGINRDGSPKVVEIDESLFFKRKYNRVRIQNG